MYPQLNHLLFFLFRQPLPPRDLPVPHLIDRVHIDIQNHGHSKLNTVPCEHPTPLSAPPRKNQSREDIRLDALKRLRPNNIPNTILRKQRGTHQLLLRILRNIAAHHGQAQPQRDQGPHLLESGRPAGPRRGCRWRWRPSS